MHISNTPFASGGEGSIHNIPECPDIVAKIFSSNAKIGYYEKKVSYMIENPPFQEPSNETIKNMLIWPQTKLRKNGIFIGYSMQKLRESVTLKNLTVLNSPLLQLPPWDKYHRGRPESFLNRLKICYNLANALKLLHQNEKYTMVDLKPDNLMIAPNGLFSVVDIDGVQIAEYNKVIFFAQAYTEDYAPPEMKTLNHKIECIPVEWDYFCFAIIVYEILLGIHPFQGTPKKGIPSLSSNIIHGLFANGSRKKQLSAIPAQHSNFKELPRPVRELLMKTLDKGAFKISLRASFQQWIDVLKAQVHNEQNEKIISISRGVRKPLWKMETVNFSFQNLINNKLLAYAGITGLLSQIKNKVNRICFQIHFLLLIIRSGGLAFIQIIGNFFRPGHVGILFFYCHTSVINDNKLTIFLSDIFILPASKNDLSIAEKIFLNALAKDFPNNNFNFKRIFFGKFDSFTIAKNEYYSIFNSYLSKKPQVNFVMTH